MGLTFLREKVELKIIYQYIVPIKNMMSYNAFLLAAFGTGLGACLVGKLSLSHSEAWFGARTLSVAMLVLTLGMIHLEPNLTTEWWVEY